MKQNKILSFLMALVTMGMFMSCGDDDEDNTIVIDSALEIAFDETSATVAENGSAVTATISFPEAPGAITVTAGVSGTATYDEDYTSSPAVSNDEVSLSIAEGDTEATITLTPMDNDDVDGSREIVLTLQAAEGLELGSNTTYMVTITDDETPKTVVDITDLRGRYEGSDINLTDQEYIQGTVISSNDNVTSKNVFIQDATGGIVVRFEEDNTLAFGDEVEINIMGGILSDFNDLVQVNELANANATVISSGNTVTPETITITQMNTGDYESQYVSIENVTFPDADGSSEDLNGNNTIDDGTQGVLRVESYASFSGNIEPLGTGTVTGVVGVYQGTYQLIPQEANDIFENNPAASIDVTQSISAFAATDNGSVSSEQVFTVEGTGISGNITITASEYFEVASPSAVTRQGVESLNYSSSIDVPGTGEQTIYVRFAPTSGTNGTKTGTIEASADGAVTQSFDVEGEETGNNESGVIFLETFDNDGGFNSSIDFFSDGEFDYLGLGNTDGTSGDFGGDDIPNYEPYNGFDGFFLCGSDLDGEGATLPAQFEWTNIDVSGESDIELSVLLAEQNAQAGENGVDAGDYILIEYQLDNGGYTNWLRFAGYDQVNGDDFNGSFYPDTDFDGAADDPNNDSPLTINAQSFAEIVSLNGASSLDIKITISVNSGFEDFGIDNLKVASSTAN